jgi:hypothetical protein
VNADEPGLLRLEALRGWQAVTTDQVTLAVIDLLLDDSDWHIDYFELGLGGIDPEGAAPGDIDREAAATHCLVDQDFVIGADPEAGRLYLAIDSTALAHAPHRPYPGPGDEAALPTVERD